MADTSSIAKRAATEPVDDPIAKRLRSHSRRTAETDLIGPEISASKLVLDNSSQVSQTLTHWTNLHTPAFDSELANKRGLPSPKSDSRSVDTRNFEPSKPYPIGRPRAWADKRGAFANAINDIRHHEGACHTRENHVVGMMLDGASSPRALISSDVIITAV